MKNKKHKIGIFGGAFNPPHIGHVQAAETAIKQLNLDKLIIVPTGTPAHKKLPKDTPPADIRYKLAELAFGQIPNIIISDLEISKKETSYSIDTVSQIVKEYEPSLIYLLIGTDMYLSLESWKEFRKLLSLATPAVFTRKPNELNKIHDFSAYLKNNYDVETTTISNQVIDISSTTLRKILPSRKGFEYVPKHCYSYIVKRSLYNTKPNFDWLRTQAYLFLKPSRIGHVQGCEEAAISLAKRWNVDPDEAREAAILHDITKNFSMHQHTEIFAYNDIKVDIADENEVKLLHPKTGAIVASNEFSVSEDVAEAIKWHTTGKINMSALEKIIYLADYIEETRDFPEVEILRKAAYNNIDDAMVMGLELSIADIKSRGITPNKASIEALRDIKENTVK